MRHLKLLTLGIVGLLAACSEPPRVLQGKVVDFDATKKVLVLEDEVAPYAQRVLDADKAEFGAPTAPGNVVRVAYHERDGKLVAGRVMNLTAQAKKPAKK